MRVSCPSVTSVGVEVSLHRELNVLFCFWKRLGSTAVVKAIVIWLTPTENTTGGGFRTSEGPAEQMFLFIHS